MSKMILAQFFNPETNKALPVASADVFDVKRKKSLETVIDGILASLEGLSAAEVESLQTELTELKATFQTFMTGEDDDNGALDRLKELVAAIQANKTTIASLVTDKATQAALDAVIALVASLESTKDYTGIAYVSGVDDEPVYTGKLQIVLQEVELDDGEGGE